MKMKKTACKLMLSALLLTQCALPAFALSGTGGDVSLRHPSRSTFRTATAQLSPASACTVLWRHVGSNTKKTKILRIWMSYTISTQSASLTDKFTLTKRSSATTGGTSTVETAVANDSTNASATSVTRSYSANPSSVGTAIGRIASFAMYGNVSTPTTPPATLIYEAPTTAQAETLNSASEEITLDLGGATLVGTPLIAITEEFTEE